MANGSGKIIVRKLILGLDSGPDPHDPKRSCVTNDISSLDHLFAEEVNEILLQSCIRPIPGGNVPANRVPNRISRTIG